MVKRVAVLGAGPMGLAVAYQLVLDGHQPVLFEADDRVGGMTATFDFAGAYFVDCSDASLCPHVDVKDLVILDAVDLLSDR